MSYGVSYSIKELLGQQDKKLDRILDRLETKAEVSSVASLDSRISEIESHGSRQAISAQKELSEVLKRIALIERSGSDNAYLVDQYKEDHKKIEHLEDELTKFQNGFTYKVSEAINANNQQIAAARREMFGKKEKVALVIFAGIGAMGTIVSCIVLFVQLAHGALF